jgi:hypothetical protein
MRDELWWAVAMVLFLIALLFSVLTVVQWIG